MADRRYKLFKQGLPGPRDFEQGDLADHDFPIWDAASSRWQTSTAAGAGAFPVGTVTNATLRWSGSAWVQTDNFRTYDTDNTGKTVEVHADTLWSAATAKTGIHAQDSAGNGIGWLTWYNQNAYLRVGEIGSAQLDGTFVRIDGANTAGALDTMAVFTVGSDVALYHDNVEVARTLAAASGGFEINNTLTGAGWERVMTESDNTFDGLGDKTLGTGDYHTTGDFVSGEGSGGVAMTINDGYGNANLTFNHRNGIPEQTGNAGRIEVNTDNTTDGHFSFEIGTNKTVGIASALTQLAKWSETALDFKIAATFTADVNAPLRIFSTGPAVLTIEADTDNVTESDTAYIKFLQDGTAVAGQIGLTGAASTLPDGTAVTGITTSDNAMMISAPNELSIAIGTEVVLRLDKGAANIWDTSENDLNIYVNDADFLVADSTDVVTGFIWRDHSANILYLGTDNAEPHFRSSVYMEDERLYFDSGKIGYLRDAVGDYGSVSAYGAAGSTAGWIGYDIGGRTVLMNNVSTDNRWYNDTNNETLIQAIENGTVRLYNNNIECLETKSSGNAVIDNLGAALHHGTAITSGRVTTSTAAPSGGSNGDVWFRY